MKGKLSVKKIVIIGVVVAVAGGGFWYMKAKGEERASLGTPVTVMPLEQKNIEESITLKAPLEGTESAEIVSKLHYEVISMNVKEGDKVKKDQILALLDAEQLQKDIRKMESDIELAVAQNNETSVKEAQGAELAKLELDDKLKNQQESYDKAVADLDIKKRELDNIKTMVKAGAETDANLRLAQDAYDDAKRTVDSYAIAEGKVIATPAELKSLEVSATTSKNSREKTIANMRQDLARKKEDLTDCQIKSPISGTVTRVNIKLGRFADDTDDDKPMFVVENIDKLQMKVLVSEYDIGRIKIGQKVTISADILGKELVDGAVSRLSPTGEQKEQSAERVIPTFIDVSGETKGLIAGINAKAKILIASSENVLIVPFESLVENPDDSKQVLRVNKENKVEIIPVETGVSSDLEVEVKSDKLAVGDNIIISPTPDLIEGSLVTAAGLSLMTGNEGGQ